MLADRYTRNALQRLYLYRARGVAQASPDTAQAAVARQRVLDDLGSYLRQMESQAVANGVSVHWADDFQEADRFVVNLLRASGSTAALRNHAPLLDEIAVDRAAAANQIDMQPLSPGDLYVQLVGSRPSHPVFPAAHLRREDVSAAAHAQWRVPVTYDTELLARSAFLRLRPALLDAKAAVIGLNFAVAATGSLVCLDNDGHNAGLVSLADHVICLLGIDRVVANLADLHLLISAYAQSAWGRPLPSYVTQVTGSDAGGHKQQVDLILVDNGRSRLLGGPFAPALRCIDCGACHNICPVFRQVGGAGYGAAARTGPIGAVTNPVVVRARAANLQPFLSSGCNACAPVCPVGIDLPGLLHDQRVRQAPRTALKEKGAFWVWQQLLSHPQLFHQALRLARRIRMR